MSGQLHLPHLDARDRQQRTAVRNALAKDAGRAQLPGGREFIVAQETDIMVPAPFMHPLGSRDYGTGNIYEMRVYTFAPGDIPKVLDGWAKAIDAREQYSPLAACWTSEIGGLNKFAHTWVYKDLNEREEDTFRDHSDLSRAARVLWRASGVTYPVFDGLN